VIVAGFRKCRDLVGEGKVFIKDKAKVASRVGCSERRVVYFRKLLFNIAEKRASLPIMPLNVHICRCLNVTLQAQLYT